MRLCRSAQSSLPTFLGQMAAPRSGKTVAPPASTSLIYKMQAAGFDSDKCQRLFQSFSLMQKHLQSCLMNTKSIKWSIGKNLVKLTTPPIKTEQNKTKNISESCDFSLVRAQLTRWADIYCIHISYCYKYHNISFFCSPYYTCCDIYQNNLFSFFCWFQ